MTYDVVAPAVLIVLCSCSGLPGLPMLFRKLSRGREVGVAIAGWLCLAAVGAVWVTRWYTAGHLPLFGTYESALSMALAVLASGVLWDAFRGNIPRVTPWACLVAAALLAQGLAFDPTTHALTISERSLVLDAHALLAWLAFGTLTANAGIALQVLLLRKEPSPMVSKLLSLSLLVGFFLHSAMLVSGSIYEFLLFGKAWSFDPIETMGFVVWVAYGTLLHLHLFAGWKGRKLATWCLFVFVLLVISYRFIFYFPFRSTYHIFDMNLRPHLVSSLTNSLAPERNSAVACGIAIFRRARRRSPFPGHAAGPRRGSRGLFNLLYGKLISLEGCQ